MPKVADAQHLGRDVEARQRLADKLELRRLLQRGAGIDDRSPTWSTSSPKVATRPPLLRRTSPSTTTSSADRHGRLAARRAQQQVARHRAGDAHGMPGIAHAGRPAGRQHAQNAAELARHPMRDVDDGALFLRRERQAVDQDVDIAIDAVLGRVFDAHLVPARVHLLGDQHGKRGLHALAHLGARHGDHHAIVARDLHPAAEAGFVRLDVEQRAFAQAIALAGKPEADAQEATTGDAADDRHAPGPLLHDAPPNSAAARCTARRMAL